MKVYFIFDRPAVSFCSFLGVGGTGLFEQSFLSSSLSDATLLSVLMLNSTTESDWIAGKDSVYSVPFIYLEC